MRALELAKDLKVETEALLQLLREMGIAVKGVSAQVSEADAAKVIARMERGVMGAVPWCPISQILDDS